MNHISKVPGLKEILEKCQHDVQELTGEKVTIHYKLKFHLLNSEDLQRFICEVCEVSWPQILSDSRKANIILARHLYCYFAYAVQRKSLWDIAHILKRSDHSTIIHARDKVIKMIEVEDEIYMPAYLAIDEKIRQVVL